jgi:hypothetical protein
MPQTLPKFALAGNIQIGLTLGAGSSLRPSIAIYHPAATRIMIREMEAAMEYLFHCAAVLLLLVASPVLAQTADEAAISKLHTTFDRPESRLTIAPVVLAGVHAIAGWAQGDMGGRALVRKKGESWELVLCAGDGIKSRDTLAKTGVPVHNAAALERDLAERKASFPRNTWPYCRASRAC